MTTLKHPVSGTVKPVTKDDFYALFDESVHGRLDTALARPGVSGIACFENIDLCSSRLGDRTALIYGPGCTAGTAEEICSQHLGDVPSRFQYPVAIYIKGA